MAIGRLAWSPTYKVRTYGRLLRTEIVPPPKESGDSSGKKDGAEALRKWRIKAGKAMFVLKTTIEEDLLEHIRDAETPKEAWETLEKLFSKKNEARLQLLEKELSGISQDTLTIGQYFTKVKSICREISELAPDEKVGEALLTLLSAPDLYTASARFRVAFPSEYSPKVYQSTEPKRQETIY